MADLKSFFSRARIERLAKTIAAVAPAFPTKAFVADAARGIDRLELLARGAQIADALQKHLPRRYEEAIAILLRSLGHPLAKDDSTAMSPFFYYPHTMFVARHGQAHFSLSMRAQKELTKHFSCEFSIRPFLVKYPTETIALLQEWTLDESADVRRLCSEGTRPRLPWGARVPWIDRQPQAVVPLLEALKDDTSPVVRRSVANHLNDWSRLDPDLTCDVAERWLKGASLERRALVAHALRSLVKKWHPRALTLLGFGKKPSVRLTSSSFTPPKVSIGGKTRVDFTLRSTARVTQALSVDLVVHFVKARGHAAPKVFKVAQVVLGPRKTSRLRKTISLAVHTTRKPNPGRHTAFALVNGERYPLGAFDVVK